MANKPSIGFHDSIQNVSTVAIQRAFGHWDTQFSYRFENFFHPFVGELIAKLNRDSLPGMLDATWQDGLKWRSLVAPTTPPADPFDAAWQDSIRTDGATPK